MRRLKKGPIKGIRADARSSMVAAPTQPAASWSLMDHIRKASLLFSWMPRASLRPSGDYLRVEVV
jgi:hypothetical protein